MEIVPYQAREGVEEVSRPEEELYIVGKLGDLLAAVQRAPQGRRRGAGIPFDGTSSQHRAIKFLTLGGRKELQLIPAHNIGSLS